MAGIVVEESVTKIAFRGISQQSVLLFICLSFTTHKREKFRERCKQLRLDPRSRTLSWQECTGFSTVQRVTPPTHTHRHTSSLCTGMQESSSSSSSPSLFTSQMCRMRLRRCKMTNGELDEHGSKKGDAFTQYR
jgi:hypothetical protein